MLGKLRTLWKELGPVEGPLYAVDQLLARTSRGRARLVRYVIVAQPVGRATAQALRPDTRTKVEHTPGDHQLVSQFPRPPGVIQRRYRDGGQCVSASTDGKFIGFIWWQQGQYEEDEVHCLYVLEDPLRCAWDYDVYIDPRHRTGRTLARLWTAVETWYQAHGVAWSFSRIATSNRASISAHARLGAVPCGKATFLIIGKLQIAWLPRTSWPHLSFANRGRPVLRLPPPDGARSRA